MEESFDTILLQFVGSFYHFRLDRIGNVMPKFVHGVGPAAIFSPMVGKLELGNTQKPSPKISPNFVSG